jgi:hypothetical protein
VQVCSGSRRVGRTWARRAGVAMSGRVPSAGAVGRGALLGRGRCRAVRWASRGAPGVLGGWLARGTGAGRAAGSAMAGRGSGARGCMRAREKSERRAGEGERE